MQIQGLGIRFVHVKPSSSIIKCLDLDQRIISQLAGEKSAAKPAPVSQSNMEATDEDREIIIRIVELLCPAQQPASNPSQRQAARIGAARAFADPFCGLVKIGNQTPPGLVRSIPSFGQRASWMTVSRRSCRAGSQWTPFTRALLVGSHTSLDALGFREGSELGGSWSLCGQVA